MNIYEFTGKKMNKEDLNADIEMNLRQIISLVDLMLEHNNKDIPNILTIRNLAEEGLEKQLKFSEILSQVE